MKISELMVRDIRATIELNNEKIIIKNPKGKVKEELLSYFQKQVDINMENVNKKGKKKKTATDVEIFEKLMKKLTNIEIDASDVIAVLNNPSYELSVVILYLSSIMQELIFEVLSIQNVQMRMQKNTLLEKDTLKMVNELDDLIKEIKHRKLIDDGEEVQ